MRSHAKLSTFWRGRGALGLTINHWLKDRYRVLVCVFHIDRMEVECSWVLHSVSWCREVISPTAVDILIIIPRRSSVRLTTLSSCECIQLGRLRLRWFELFELLLKSVIHSVTDFFCVLFVVLHDWVNSLKWLCCSFWFTCGNSARLSRLRSCYFFVMKYTFCHAFPVL